MELDIDRLTGLLNQAALARRMESGEPFTGVVAVCDRPHPGRVGRRSEEISWVCVGSILGNP